MINSGISNFNAIAKVVSLHDVLRSPAGSERQKVGAGGKSSPQSPAGAQSGIGVTEALWHILEYVPSLSRDLRFRVDESTHSPVITVLDSATNEVVRQIPAEELIAIARYLVSRAPESPSGLLLDSRE